MFFFFNERATQKYIDRRHPSTSTLESFFFFLGTGLSGNPENHLEKNFEKFGFTSRGCRVCLATCGNADPLTTGSSGCVGSQRTLSLAKAFLSDVRQSEVDFLPS